MRFFALLLALAAAPSVQVAPDAFTFGVRGHTVHADAVPRDLLGSYQALANAELSRYPAAILTALKLKSITLCGPLTADGIAFNGMADWDDHTLYLTVLDVGRVDHYARVVVHHELFHMLDQYKTRNLAYDPTWTALNAKGFAYGDGGEGMREADASHLGSAGQPGFVTRYATTGVDEDKAETFAHLMVDRDWVLDRARGDDALQRKVTLLRARLNSYAPGFGDAL